jgi:rhodanese-related sulfurtransferase
MSGIATATLWQETKRPRRHDEDDLQRAVFKYLRWSLPADGEVIAIPNGGQRHSKAAARLAGLGVRPGAPDLWVGWRRNTFWIELKTPIGQVSEVQRQMHTKLTHCGFPVLVCRSVAGVENSLRELGVPLRGSCT